MGLPLHDIGYRSSEIIIDLLKQEEKRETESSITYVDCKAFIRQSVNRINEEKK